MNRSENLLNEEKEYKGVNDIKSADNLSTEQLSEKELNDVSGGTVYDVVFNAIKTKKR